MKPFTPFSFDFTVYIVCVQPLQPIAICWKLNYFVPFCMLQKEIYVRLCQPSWALFLARAKVWQPRYFEILSRYARFFDGSDFWNIYNALSHLLVDKFQNFQFEQNKICNTISIKYNKKEQEIFIFAVQINRHWN